MSTRLKPAYVDLHYVCLVVELVPALLPLDLDAVLGAGFEAGLDLVGAASSRPQSSSLGSPSGR